MPRVYLLLCCFAREGATIHGVFPTEEGAKAAFEELATTEWEMVHQCDPTFDDEDPCLMRMDWDHGPNNHGWVIREVPLGQVFAHDVALTPP